MAVRSLSLPERLRLAALILEELPQLPMAQIDLAAFAEYNDAWTDEDIQDLRQFSARYLNSLEAYSEAEQDDALPPLEELLKMKVVVDFPGVTTTKRRPAVVVSSQIYHSQRLI